MAKVHITLVGGQPAPVYNGIIATNPDKVVYIYSHGSRQVVDTLKQFIKIETAPSEPLDAKRIVSTAPDGNKVTTFRFVKFRPYEREFGIIILLSFLCS